MSALFRSPWRSTKAEAQEAQCSPIQEKQEKLSNDETDMMDDITQVHQAIDYFLNSQIHEAEKVVHAKKSLYYSLGHSFILFLRCMMTFESADIVQAMDAWKETIEMASRQRKSYGLLVNISTWKGGHTVDHIKQMSLTQLHAELVFAESYLLRALLSIVHEESILCFVRESVNIRTSYLIYRSLFDFVKEHNGTLDQHFRSGVFLGYGCFNIILSMLPPTALKVVEFFGFSADRQAGLRALEEAGCWPEGPGVTWQSKRGLRKELCDMALLMYHIVLPKMIPLSNVNVPLAEQILEHNLSRYPNGVILLYFEGRLLASKRNLNQAHERYMQAIRAQEDWKQLQHICYWELGIIYIIRQDWSNAHATFEKLYKNSNWSKAVYLYLMTISFIKLHPDQTTKAEELIRGINSAKQKIAGKSVPIEKFVSRKARTFIQQKNYLYFPDLEFLNAINAFDFMPLDVLTRNLNSLQTEPLQVETDQPTYWDNVCLRDLLQAVTARQLIALEHNEEDMHTIHDDAINAIEKHQSNSHIHHDHYIYYFALYERACLRIVDDKIHEAEKILHAVLRTSERHSTRYSLAGPLCTKCHNSIARISALAQAGSH